MFRRADTSLEWLESELKGALRPFDKSKPESPLLPVQSVAPAPGGEPDAKNGATGSESGASSFECATPRSIRWAMGLDNSIISASASRSPQQRLLAVRRAEREKYEKRSAEIWRVRAAVKAEFASGSGGNSKEVGDDGSKDSKDSKLRDRVGSLLKLVEKDVRRTNQEDPFFRSQNVKETLTRILLAWGCAPTSGALGYRQGMNELLAVCLCVVKNDAAAQKEDAQGEGAQDSAEHSTADAPGSAWNEVCSTGSVEADTYGLFKRLMLRMAPLYHTARGQGTGTGSADLQTPLDKAVRRVHHVLLRRLDPELYFALERVGVLPQLYMIRWVRLLFAREAPQPQLLLLLDYLLESADGFVARVEFLCLALTVAMRKPLLAMQNNSGLVLAAILRKQSVVRAAALLRVAKALEGDKTLSKPAAKMLIFNSPVQNHGGRTVGAPASERLGGGRDGKSRARSARPAMEGYILGVKSETLYWCVLDGAQMAWYSDPGRTQTVARTWLDGCTIEQDSEQQGRFQILGSPNGARDRQIIRLEVSSLEERQAWLTQLRRAVEFGDVARAGSGVTNSIWRQCFM